MQQINQPPAVAPEGIMRLDSSMIILGSLAQKYMISSDTTNHSPKKRTLFRVYKKVYRTIQKKYYPIVFVRQNNQI